MAADMESEADVAIDVADDVAADISNTAHELMGRIQSGPPSWAWFQAKINYQLTKFQPNINNQLTRFRPKIINQNKINLKKIKYNKFTTTSNQI